MQHKQQITNYDPSKPATLFCFLSKLIKKKEQKQKAKKKKKKKKKRKRKRLPCNILCGRQETRHGMASRRLESHLVSFLRNGYLSKLSFELLTSHVHTQSIRNKCTGVKLNPVQGLRDIKDPSFIQSNFRI